MKKNVLLILVLMAAVSSFYSCKKDEPQSPNIVSQFVYDGMSQYYLWADDMKSIKPTSSDANPSTYFEKILSPYDRFSWITDDVDGLMAEFAGEPKSFGFELMVLWKDATKTSIVAYVKYVYPNTPASNAGIVRGNIITKINGQTITLSNYETLFGTSGLTLTVSDQNNLNPKEVAVAPTIIKTNPILYSNIYNIDGHKIAYLFYTGFIDNYNDSLYEKFDYFKQQGVTDLVLDLRYNHGGAVTAATYLSSLIAPKTVVQNKAALVKMMYNNNVNEIFKYYYDRATDAQKGSYDRTDFFGEYDSSSERNPLNANLDLSKVYIIATGDSYSASELTTFCLKSYMNVVHIGDTTGGKYLASWTIHPYSEQYGVPIYDSTKLSVSQINTFKKWAMQPIVAKYTNKDGIDFSNPGFLVPNYVLKEGGGVFSQWKPIGDTRDTYLAQAIYLITGNQTYKPVNLAYVKGEKYIGAQKQMVNLPSSVNLKNGSVRLNNVKVPVEIMKGMFQ